jgi:hypothetical protein
VDLAKLLGDDFPKRRQAAAQLIHDVEWSVQRYALSEALRRTESDTTHVKQLERVAACARQLLELLQVHDSTPRGDRPALAWLPRVVDVLERSRSGGDSRFTTATVRANLTWLSEAIATVQTSQQTDWAGKEKPKRQRGAPAGRRANQVTLAADLAIGLCRAGIAAELGKEYWKGPTGAYATLVHWALGREGGQRRGNWAAVAQQGMKTFRAQL